MDGFGCTDLIESQTIAIGEVLLLSIVATDVDTPDNILTYSLDEGAPVGMTIDPSTGKLAWQTDAGTAIGDYDVSVRISDGTDEVISPFTVTARPNTAPRILDAEDQSTAFEKQLRLHVAVTDPDFQAIEFEAEVLPLPDESIAATVSVKSVSIIADEDEPVDTADDRPFSVVVQPENGYLGTFQILLRASDGIDAVEQAVSVNVHPNTAPVFGSVGGFVVSPGDLLQREIPISDVDGDVVTFQLLNAPAGLELHPSGRISWSPAPDIPVGDYQVTVAAMDNGSPPMSSTADLTIAVRQIGDLNHDSSVDRADVALLLSNFGLTGDLTVDDGDLDGSGSINLHDLAILKVNLGLGQLPSPATAQAASSEGSMRRTSALKALRRASDGTNREYDVRQLSILASDANWRGRRSNADNRTRFRSKHVNMARIANEAVDTVIANDSYLGGVRGPEMIRARGPRSAIHHVLGRDPR